KKRVRGLHALSVGAIDWLTSVWGGEEVNRWGGEVFTCSPRHLPTSPSSSLRLHVRLQLRQILIQRRGRVVAGVVALMEEREIFLQCHRRQRLQRLSVRAVTE